jgi:hypothetical protein
MNATLSLPLAALLALCSQGFAQAPHQPATPKPTAVESLQALKAVVEDAPDPANLKAMKSKVFVIQHLDPYRLHGSLEPLASGTRGAKMTSQKQEGLNTISVRDFPENLAAIEEAIKRLDVPTNTQQTPDVELHIQVLFASKQATPEGNVPEELREVIKSLKGALAYRSYTLATSFVQRCDTKGHTIQGRGVLEGADTGFGSVKNPSQLTLEWEASNGLELEQHQSASPSILIRKFQFYVNERSSKGSETLAKIETGVTLREGEHVVVGTSVVKDQGLIVVLTANQVK